MVPESEHLVREASLAEISAIANCLGDAFSRDPFNQWVFPDPSTRRAQLTDFLGELTERSIKSGALVDVVDDLAAKHQAGESLDGQAIAAAAVWDPPGVAVHADFQVLRDEVVDALEQIYAAQPTVPHWYLDILSARGGGQGYGSALLGHRLHHLDAAHESAALWTATDANVRLYQRHGFEVANEVRFGGPVYVRWLWREAR
jgi:ribosomal protein S18 acetylase RimI-like enzyme